MAALKVAFLVLSILFAGVFQPVGGSTDYANDAGIKIATGYSNAVGRTNATEPCQLVGNTDLYGIGVRTSLYLQWASITTAYLIAPSQSTPAFIAAFIISLSIWISLISNSSGNGSDSMDLLIGAYETCYLFLGTRHIPLSYFNELRFMLLTLVVNFVTFVLSLFQIRHYIQRSRDQDFRRCFPNIMIGSGYGAGFVFFFVCLALVCLCLLLWGLHQILYDLKRSEHERAQRAWEIDQSLGLLARLSSTMFPFAPALLAICIVEASIQKNQIDLSAAPLTSTGQLIPFLTGVFNLCVVLWCGFRSGWREYFLQGIQGMSPDG